MGKFTKSNIFTNKLKDKSAYQVVVAALHFLHDDVEESTMHENLINEMDEADHDEFLDEEGDSNFSRARGLSQNEILLSRDWTTLNPKEEVDIFETGKKLLLV